MQGEPSLLSAGPHSEILPYALLAIPTCYFNTGQSNAVSDDVARRIVLDAIERGVFEEMVCHP